MRRTSPGREFEERVGGVPLDIVIVAFRSRELVLACLESVFAHPPAGGARVQVVDNASGDGTVDSVGARFPAVEVIANEENLGFAAANNAAIERGSAPFVLALNPDTRVVDGSLDRLLAVMEAESRVGICGPRLELEDGSFDHAARRSFPTPLSALGHFTGAGRLERSPASLSAYRAPDVERGEVDAVNGACMLIRRAALDEVGRFDEGYWMYMEDLDLCYRMREAGWLTWYEPSAKVIHVKAGTSGPNRSLRLNRAFHYGMYRFYRKHYAAERNPVMNWVVYTGIAVKLAASALASAVKRGLGRIRRG